MTMPERPGRNDRMVGAIDCAFAAAGLLAALMILPGVATLLGWMIGLRGAWVAAPGLLALAWIGAGAAVGWWRASRS